MTDLDVVFLGTGGSVPTARRATASVLVRRGGERLLFDCGEGTQRQMQRSTGLVQVDDIFITHFHLDHYLGLPGLVKTYDLHGRESPLRVLAPRGLHRIWGALRPVIGNVSYEIDLVELDIGEEVTGDGYVVMPIDVDHRTRALGYALVEDRRPGAFDVERARALAIPEGPEWGRLQRGETVISSAGVEVSPAEVMGAEREGRKVVITGDTRPCEPVRIAAHEADLLVHDASFLELDAGRAHDTGHSTARECAELAAAAESRFLAMVHISTRYPIREALAEARSAFAGAEAPRDFDLVEIPFAERGGPRLVENGARLGPDERATSAQEPPNVPRSRP